MWMVGYNEGGEFNMADYPFNGSRKLRPLMPRPVVTSPNNTTSTCTNTNNTPCLTRIHHHAGGNDFFSQYHNLGSVGEQGKREFNSSPPVVVSSRWNPTPEQLRALEELYRRGTRTPSAEQIQQITAQLRRFGKIEGKNVFYWFQNHKARERQKRRRQMESAAEGHPRDFDTTLEKHKDLGASRTVCEVEQTKTWVPSSTNCSTLAEESVSIQRAAKAAVAECRTDGWVQFDELGSELQQRRNYLMERNATWHMTQFSCPNLNPIVTSTTSMMPTSTTVVASNARAMDPKFIKTHDLSFFISPHTPNGGVIHLSTINSEDDNNNNSVESHQTLQLFPIRNGDGTSGDIDQHKETEISASEMNAPSQFFEFLPLKN